YSYHMAAALSYQMPACAYSLIANPSLHYLEATLAMLESYGFGGDASACVTGSGMAAIFMATNPFLAHERCAGADGGHRSGVRMNIVASAKCYGGTVIRFRQRVAAAGGGEGRCGRAPLNAAG